jgi:Fe-S-cluster containining protein
MAKDKTKNKDDKRKGKKGKAKAKAVTEIPVTTENKCDLCVQSICCTYITHQIDTPRSMEDFDYLLWQISHQDVSVFKDEDGWFLSVGTRCTHLLPNGMCGIYEKRPQICREHSNDCCEFDGPAEEDFDKYFNSFDSLDKFCRKKFKKWDKRFKKWNKSKK